MFNEQQIPVKYDVMLSYPPFPLDWKVLPSSTGAQQERWKRLWTKSDTLATAANHWIFLGVRNHIFTVTLLFVLLFCLFALNHGGIEVKCRWITHRGKQHFAMNFPVSHSSCNCWVSWSQPNCVKKYKHNKPVHSTRVICHW